MENIHIVKKEKFQKHTFKTNITAGKYIFKES